MRNRLLNRALSVNVMPVLFAALIAAVPLISCSSDKPDDQQPQAPSVPVAITVTPPAPQTTEAPEIPADALNAYHAAIAAVRAGDMEEAREKLSLAASIKPDFTEAWYNLGAATSLLAIEAMRDGREAESVALLREAVEDKKKAQGLIDEGKWFIYKTAAEQEQVRSDLANALVDADEMLADENVMIAALKIWAGVQ